MKCKKCKKEHSENSLNCRECKTEAQPRLPWPRGRKRRRVPAEQSPEWKKQNRADYLMLKYCITPEIYDAMLQEQDYKCAICLRRPTTKKPLAVDHHHQTGIVRGLLCNNCNSGIGFLQEDPEVMRNAVVYVEKHNKKFLPPTVQPSTVSHKESE